MINQSPHRIHRIWHSAYLASLLRRTTRKELEGKERNSVELTEFSIFLLLYMDTLLNLVLVLLRVIYIEARERI